MTTGSDLILGVARAADANKHREAVARLERLSGQTARAADAATTAAETAASWSTAVRTTAANVPRATAPIAPPRATDGSKPDEVYVQFEAVLLQNMVENMMPKDSEAMFGSGTAGSIWKSMLAEKIAAEIARAGTVGLAKQIAAGQAAISGARAASGPKAGDA
jgi:Rod binding domain-containing protein